MVLCCLYLLFFFFKQKTAYEMRISDWSSDVCSSDLWSTTPPSPKTASTGLSACWATAKAQKPPCRRRRKPEGDGHGHAQQQRNARRAPHPAAERHAGFLQEARHRAGRRRAGGARIQPADRLPHLQSTGPEIGRAHV